MVDVSYNKKEISLGNKYLNKQAIITLTCFLNTSLFSNPFLKIIMG